MNSTLRWLLPALMTLTLMACTPTSVKEDGADEPGHHDDDSHHAMAPVSNGGDSMSQSMLDTDPMLVKRVVWFEYDKANVLPEYRGVLEAHSQYLSSHPTARVTLEGHADERGTREYNLGLGERRAAAVADVMSAYGARGGQSSNVSYGEERPVAGCHEEACWSQNRRVEIIYTSR